MNTHNKTKEIYGIFSEYIRVIVDVIRGIFRLNYKSNALSAAFAVLGIILIIIPGFTLCYVGEMLRVLCGPSIREG